MDIFMGYKTMNDLKQETITDRNPFENGVISQTEICINDRQQLKSEIWVY